MDVDSGKQPEANPILGSKDDPIIIDEDMHSPIESHWIPPPKNQVEGDSVLRYLSYIIKALHAQGLKEDAERNLKSYKDQYKSHSEVRTKIATEFGLPNSLSSGTAASWVDGRSMRYNVVSRSEDEMIAAVERMYAFLSPQEGDPSAQQLALAMKARNQRFRDGSLRSSILSAQEDLQRIRDLHEHGDSPQATLLETRDAPIDEVTDFSQSQIFELQDRLESISEGLDAAEEWAIAPRSETKDALRAIVENYPFDTLKPEPLSPESDGETTITEPSQDADQQAFDELRLAKSTFDEHQKTCDAYYKLLKSQLAKSGDDREKIMETTAKIESSTSTLNALDAELADLIADVTKNTSRSFSIEEAERRKIYEEAKDACNSSLRTSAALADLNPQFMASRGSMLHFDIPDSKSVASVRERLDAAHQLELKALHNKASQGIAYLLARGRAQQERLEQEHKHGAGPMTGA